MGNRPDCAYFLLLGLCLATFLLAVGGILTFNLTFDLHPHTHHQPHLPNCLHLPSTPIPETNQLNHSLSNNQTQSRTKTTTENHPTTEQNSLIKQRDPLFPSQGSNNGESPGESQSDSEQGRRNPLKETNNSRESDPHPNETPGGHLERETQNKYKIVDSSLSTTATSGGCGESKKFVLAIIGPLLVLMGTGILVGVGVVALKYDCDHEPETELAFLRLKSELSLNFVDPEKNNYELMRRIPEQSGIDRGSCSINA